MGQLNRPFHIPGPQRLDGQLSGLIDRSPDCLRNGLQVVPICYRQQRSTAGTSRADQLRQMGIGIKRLWQHRRNVQRLPLPAQVHRQRQANFPRQPGMFPQAPWDDPPEGAERG